MSANINTTPKEGDKFKSKNGQIAEVKNFGGILRLEVKNNLGKVTQTISLSKIDLSLFERLS